MIDRETTARITDPSEADGTIAVRVLFTKEIAPFAEQTPHVYGVFRLSDDSEVDFTTLSEGDKDTILTACEKELSE